MIRQYTEDPNKFEKNVNVHDPIQQKEEEDKMTEQGLKDAVF
jgi:hypothetical protein